MRDQKNQNILSADTVDSEDSSDDDDEGDNEAEKQKGNTSSNLLIKQYQNINVADSNVAPNEVNPLATHEAFITDHIKQSLEKNLPIDLKITHKLRPRQATFPYFATAHKQNLMIMEK